jgi:XTP/dITP diphosphohydrolase
MKLVVATGNKGKLKEIRRLLEPLAIEVVGLDQFPELPEIVEDGDSFKANARKKAETVARYSRCLTLADDSGLEVDALQGRPGIYSARYAGEDATDRKNNEKLLNDLRTVPAGKRQAAFICAMALCTPEGECRFFSGLLSGIILEQPSGDGGFGYDPLFWIPEHEKTAAELSLDVKNQISHRGQALRQVVEFLQGR